MASTGLFNHVGTVHRAMGHANADETKSNGSDRVMFELSRDYEKAWQLIQQGDRLACWVDYEVNHKDIACAYKWHEIFLITVRGTNYIYLYGEENNFDKFCQQCAKLNVIFYLPIPDLLI